MVLELYWFAGEKGSWEKGKDADWASCCKRACGREMRLGWR